MRATGRQSLFLVVAALAMGTLISGHLFGSTPAIEQAGASTDNATSTTTAALTADMLAANGPLPGNLSLYATEVACSAVQ
jgi:hypothetical protein